MYFRTNDFMLEADSVKEFVAILNNKECQSKSRLYLCESGIEIFRPSELSTMK